MYVVFIRAALINETYFWFSQHMCLLTDFHYGLNTWVAIFENIVRKY